MSSMLRVLECTVLFGISVCFATPSQMQENGRFSGFMCALDQQLLWHGMETFSNQGGSGGSENHEVGRQVSQECASDYWMSEGDCGYRRRRPRIAAAGRVRGPDLDEEHARFVCLMLRNMHNSIHTAQQVWNGQSRLEHIPPWNHQSIGCTKLQQAQRRSLLMTMPPLFAWECGDGFSLMTLGGEVCEDAVCDGHKQTCIPERTGEHAKSIPSLIYSFGSRNDLSFERDLVLHWGNKCEVHIFDCFSIDEGKTIETSLEEHRTFLHGWCLDAVDEPEQGRLSFASIVKKLGHTGRDIDLLKMDVEGWEWYFFEQLAAWSHQSAAVIHQISFELHSRILGTWPEVQLGSLDHARLFAQLYRLGYHFISWVPNSAVLEVDCAEFTLMLDKRVALQAAEAQHAAWPAHLPDQFHGDSEAAASGISSASAPQQIATQGATDPGSVCAHAVQMEYADGRSYVMCTHDPETDVMSQVFRGSSTGSYILSAVQHLCKTGALACEKGNTFVEAGAMFGYVSLYLAALGMQVHAIEPMEVNANLIRASVAANKAHLPMNIYVHEVGVGSGQQIPINHVDGSFAATSLCIPGQEFAEQGFVEVQTNSISNLTKGKAANLLLINCQGCELEAVTDMLDSGMAVENVILLVPPPFGGQCAIADLAAQAAKELAAAGYCVSELLGYESESEEVAVERVSEITEWLKAQHCQYCEGPWLLFSKRCPGEEEVRQRKAVGGAEEERACVAEGLLSQVHVVYDARFEMLTNGAHSGISKMWLNIVPFMADAVRAMNGSFTVCRSSAYTIPGVDSVDGCEDLSRVVSGLPGKNKLVFSSYYRVALNSSAGNICNFMPIYDFIPERMQLKIKKEKMEDLLLKTANLPYANGFLSLSNNTSEDLADLHGVDRCFVSTSPNRVSPFFKPVARGIELSITEKHGDPGQEVQDFINGGGKYILLNGYEYGSLPYKGYDTFWEGLSRMPRSFQQEFTVINIGPLPVHDFEVTAQLWGLGNVQESILPHLYSRAAVFVYPSRYEGFGMPPLEAIACGCPVILGPFYRERMQYVYGDDALYAGSAAEMEAALHRVSRGEVPELERLVARAARYGLEEQFGWNEVARDYLEQMLTGPFRDVEGSDCRRWLPLECRDSIRLEATVDGVEVRGPPALPHRFSTR